MPTVGRVIAQTMGSPLKVIVREANNKGAYMRANGALTDSGRMVLKQEMTKRDIKTVKEFAQSVKDFIVAIVKWSVSVAETSQKPLSSNQIKALESIKKGLAGMKSEKMQETLAEEIQKIEKLTSK